MAERILPSATPPRVMNEVFISYSRADSERVRALVERLRAAGVSLWIDDRIGAASSWTDEIVSAIEGCKVFLILLSGTSIQSENVTNELQLALEEKKRRLPALLEETVIPKNMRYQLAGVQYVELYGDEATIERSFAQILQALDHNGVAVSEDALGQAARLLESGAAVRRRRQRFALSRRGAITSAGLALAGLLVAVGWRVVNAGDGGDAPALLIKLPPDSDSMARSMGGYAAVESGGEQVGDLRWDVGPDKDAAIRLREPGTTPPSTAGRKEAWERELLELSEDLAYLDLVDESYRERILNLWARPIEAEWPADLAEDRTLSVVLYDSYGSKIADSPPFTLTDRLGEIRLERGD